MNEFKLPAFTGVLFVVDHVNVSASLKDMKEDAYNELKSDEYRDYCTQMPKGIAKLLYVASYLSSIALNLFHNTDFFNRALADVVKVDLVVDSAYNRYFNASILSKINKRYKKKTWEPPKRSPSCIKAELEDLISVSIHCLLLVSLLYSLCCLYPQDFEDDCFEDIEGFQDKLSKMRLNQTNSAVKRLLSFVSRQ